MRGRDDEFDLDESDDLDDDGPGYGDGADDDPESNVMPCPHCFGTIYDESLRCPHCGEYLSKDDIPFRPPLWIVITVGVCLIIVARWIVGF